MKKRRDLTGHTQIVTKHAIIRDSTDRVQCLRIMNNRYTMTNKHSQFRTSQEATKYLEKMRKVSVEMLRYYYPRMSPETQARADEIIDCITQDKAYKSRAILKLCT